MPGTNKGPEYDKWSSMLDPGEATRLLAMLAAGNPDMSMAVFDPAGCFVFSAGRHLPEVSGLPSEEICGKFAHDIWPEAWADLEPLFRHALGGGPAEFEYEHQDRVWKVRLYPLPSEEGSIDHVGACIHDMTASRRAEAVLAERRDHIQDVLESTTDAFFEVDHDFRVTYMNRKAEGPMQRAREEVLGNNLWEVFPEAVDTTFYEEYHRALRERRSVEFEEYFAPYDTWFEVHAYPTPQGLSVYFRDVSERKRHEERLREADEVISGMLANLPIVLYRLDRELRFTMSAGAGLRPLGLEDGEAVGQNLADGYPSVVSEARRALEGETRIFLDEVRNGQETFWFQNYLFPNSDGSGVTAIAVNVTDRIRLENDLRVAKEAAEAANDAKSEFLANMSHELRTPLNGIMGMLQLLRMSELDARQTTFVNTALDTSHDLLALISDLLDLTRVETGDLTIQSRPFTLRSLVQGVARTYRPQAALKGVQLATELDDTADRKVWGDVVRIRQILSNVVSNAVKFTDEGEVRIRASLADCAGERYELCLDVQDTGVGIPEEHQKYIFEAFTQVDGSMSRKSPGLGLGLRICRRLAELMHGSIGLDSQTGNGTTVFVRVPVSARPADAGASGPAPPPLESEPVRQPRLEVLVVEDDPVSRISISKYLEGLGHTVTHAENGEEAVDKAHGRAFDLVLMDIRLPDMDGVEATRLIRQLSDERAAKVPILAVTSYAMKGDRENLLRSGLDGYISKPVDFDSLARAISRAIDGRSAS